MVPVLSLVDRQSGEVYSQVVNDVSGHTLHKAMADVMNTPTVDLVTDGGTLYKAIANRFASHESVDHSHHEYVRGRAPAHPLS